MQVKHALLNQLKTLASTGKTNPLVRRSTDGKSRLVFAGLEFLGLVGLGCSIVGVIGELQNSRVAGLQTFFLMISQILSPQNCQLGSCMEVQCSSIMQITKNRASSSSSCTLVIRHVVI